MRYVDLFCGLGGFRLAVRNLGGECVFACDISPKARRVYERNFGETPQGDIWGAVEQDAIPDHDILTGGFPCQPFSALGNRKGLDDHRGNLFEAIGQILRAKKPKAFLLENVPGLLSQRMSGALERILYGLRGAGYSVVYDRFRASRHVPQTRERVFFLGIRQPDDACPVISGHPDRGREERFRAGVSYSPCLGDILLSDDELRRQHDYESVTQCAHIIASRERRKQAAKSASGGLRNTYLYTRHDRHGTLTRKYTDGGSFLADPNDVDDLCQASGNRRLNTQYLTRLFGARDRHYTLTSNYRATGAFIAADNEMDDVEKPSLRRELIPGASPRWLCFREAARLMGFPDSFTILDRAGKPICKHSGAIGLLGNSVVVPLIEDLLRRIEARIEQVNLSSKGGKVAK